MNNVADILKDTKFTKYNIKYINTILDNFYLVKVEEENLIYFKNLNNMFKIKDKKIINIIIVSNLNHKVFINYDFEKEIKNAVRNNIEILNTSFLSFLTDEEEYKRGFDFVTNFRKIVDEVFEPLVKATFFKLRYLQNIKFNFIILGYVDYKVKQYIKSMFLQEDYNLIELDNFFKNKDYLLIDKYINMSNLTTTKTTENE